MEPAKGSASSTASARSSMNVRFVLSAGSRRHLPPRRQDHDHHDGRVSWFMMKPKVSS